MSGTSLDGIDAIVADLSGDRPQLLATRYVPFVDELRDRIRALCTSGLDELDRSAVLANDLADLYGNVVHGTLALAGVSPRDVTAIGCHGQTIRHQPELGYTIQIGNAARLAEQTGITVVADFRSRDVAAGGQGAPLVPAFHHAMFGDRAVHRVIVNIGGISNLTDLPPDGTVHGFDCGPGNVMLDSWAYRHLGKRFDEAGSWAGTGSVLPALLERLLTHPFFHRPPPKSADREAFSLQWLDTQRVGNESPADVQATLARLVARGIADAVLQHCAPAGELFVCGGGAHNSTLLRELRAALPAYRLALTAELGVDPDWVEALAFAWLAKQSVEGRAASVPEVTGARHPCVLGAIYPA